MTAIVKSIFKILKEPHKFQSSLLWEMVKPAGENHGKVPSGSGIFVSSLPKVVVVVYLLNCVPLLCDPMDCSPPGSFVYGISQARTLEWVAISFSKGSSPPRDRIQVSCIFCLANVFFTTDPPGKCVCVECLQLEYPGPIFTRQY